MAADSTRSQRPDGQVRFRADLSAVLLASQMLMLSGRLRPSDADTAASLRVPHGYRKRSPGWRPLVGCSHRRQARPTCRASRSRSCSRT